MRLIKPITVTNENGFSIDDDMLLSSTPALESEFDEWSDAESYDTGEKVYIAETHTEWEALQDSLNGTDDAPGVDEGEWLELGATNIWRLFDRGTGLKCSATSTISVTVRLGTRIDGIALFALNASEVQIVVDDDVDGVIYDETFDLVEEIPEPSWWYWLNTPVSKADKLLVRNVPGYTTADITITITTDGGGVAECGEIAFGVDYDIGIGLWGSSVGGEDFSKIEFDQFGFATFAQGGYNDWADFDGAIQTDRVAYLKRLLKSVRGVPAVFAGDDDGEYETLIYGIAGQPKIDIEANWSSFNIEIQGLT